MNEELKILLIEDDEVDRLTIRRALKSISIKSSVESADTARGGYETLGKGDFDFLFLDYKLPDQDGFEFMKKIRAEGYNLPVVIITSHGDEAIAAEAIKAGASDYISKSLLTPEGLSQSIRNVIKWHQEEQKRARAEEALKQTEKLLGNVVSNVPIVMFALDRNGVFTLSEGRGLHKLGLQSGEAVGISAFDLYKDTPQVVDNIKRALKGEAFSEAVKIAGRVFETYYNPVINDKNEVISVNGVSIDISKRVIAEEQVVLSQANLSALIENTPAAIWSLDKSYNFISFNSVCAIEFVKTFRVSVEEGLNILSLVPDEVLAIWKPLFEKGFLGERVIDESEYFFDDRYFDLQVSCNPIRSKSGNITGITVFAWNISERKQNEKELIKAREKAEESAQIKQEFLANMSHEIRTPMNAILGFSRILLKADINEEHSGYIHSIYHSAENLLTIINDILDFSKIEAGKLNIEETWFDLSEIFKQQQEMFSYRAKEKDIRLKYYMEDGLPQALEGDPVRINQILVNLMGNAVKFTEKGFVEVNARLLEDNEKDVIIGFEVKDTGIGIAKDKLDTIFDSFTQAKGDTTRIYGGTGLGLTIVRKLVGLMSGGIQVESSIGQGTTFKFWLPLKKSSIDAAQNKKDKAGEELQTEELGNLKILLAEDNLMNQALAKKVLADFGFEVDIADNGQIAVDKVKVKTYDLVLMDLQMPVMDGIEATRKIRALKPPLNELPVMAMTAHALQNEVDKCVQAGMNDYITKPFKPGVLYRKIAAIVEEATRVNNEPIISDQQTNGEAPNTDKITNLDYLNELASGSNEFVCQMIEMFLEQTPIALDNLEKALEEKDWEAVRQIAHKMKPSISFVGISPLESVVAELEANARDEQHLDQMRSLQATLNELCDVAMAELKVDIKAYQVVS